MWKENGTFPNLMPTCLCLFVCLCCFVLCLWNESLKFANLNPTHSMSASYGYGSDYYSVATIVVNFYSK
uniref:Uncharacterized protein n=1 Tax=Anopheles quadriannulatus TaxID=34691 RepID=A0A182XTM6_ANOQN